MLCSKYSEKDRELFQAQFESIHNSLFVMFCLDLWFKFVRRSGIHKYSHYNFDYCSHVTRQKAPRVQRGAQKDADGLNPLLMSDLHANIAVVLLQSEL